MEGGNQLTVMWWSVDGHVTARWYCLPFPAAHSTLLVSVPGPWAQYWSECTPSATPGIPPPQDPHMQNTEFSDLVVQDGRWACSVKEWQWPRPWRKSIDIVGAGDRYRESERKNGATEHWAQMNTFSSKLFQVRHSELFVPGVHSQALEDDIVLKWHSQDPPSVWSGMPSPRQHPSFSAVFIVSCDQCCSSDLFCSCPAVYIPCSTWVPPLPPCVLHALYDIAFWALEGSTYCALAVETQLSTGGSDNHRHALAVTVGKEEHKWLNYVSAHND